MPARVAKIKRLSNVLSASGVEHHADRFYVMGDDSPFLYVLNKNYKLNRKIKLFKAKQKKSGRIRKKLKPDYEAMTFSYWNGKERLLMFGSGSKITREKLLVVDVEKESARTHSLHGFFKLLKRKAKIAADNFNLEAATTHNGYIYLFDRGTNTVFWLKETEFAAFITGNSKRMVSLICKKVKLPMYKGVQAGFSGACTVGDKIYFSASLERTSNWIDDGEVLGSYMGILIPGKIVSKPPSHFITRNKKPFVAKVESLTFLRKRKGVIYLAAVTDEDNGKSELLEIRSG